MIHSNFKILASLHSWADSFEPHLIVYPEQMVLDISKHVFGVFNQAPSYKTFYHAQLSLAWTLSC